MTHIFVNTDGNRFAIRIAIALRYGTTLGVERQWRGRQARLPMPRLHAESGVR